MKPDWIRERVKERARSLGVTPYAIAQKVTVSERALYDFFSGNTDMTSRRLGQVLDVLKLDLVEIAEPASS